MLTLNGEPGLLSIPCSNADTECGFSVFRKVHTDHRASLSQETIVHFKFNDSSCCFDSKLTDELITKYKKATLLSLGK